eukprot:6399110-Prymnesium_polylepis.1
MRHFRRFVGRCQALSGAARRCQALPGAVRRCQTVRLSDCQDCQAVNDSLTSDADGTSHTWCQVGVRLVSGRCQVGCQAAVRCCHIVKHCQAL